MYDLYFHVSHYPLGVWSLFYIFSRNNFVMMKHHLTIYTQKNCMTSVFMFFNLLLIFAVFSTSFTYLPPHPGAGSPQVLGAATVHLPPDPRAGSPQVLGAAAVPSNRISFSCQ